jgi:hypothetical protein
MLNTDKYNFIIYEFCYKIFYFTGRHDIKFVDIFPCSLIESDQLAMCAIFYQSDTCYDIALYLVIRYMTHHAVTRVLVMTRW